MRYKKIFLALVVSFCFLAGFSSPVSDTNDLANTYVYCPDTISNKIYYCRGNSLEVHDYIYVYDYETNKSTVAIKPSAGSWDSYHVCDPSVVAYKCSYNGVDYNYLMAYLGCDNGNNQNNQVGIAASVDGKKWKKIRTKNLKLGKSTGWGIGQPTLFPDPNNADNLLLFYTIENITDHIRNDGKYSI